MKQYLDKSDFDYIKAMSEYYLYGSDHVDLESGKTVKSKIQSLARQGHIKAIQSWYFVKGYLETDETIDNMVSKFESIEFDQAYASFLMKTQLKQDKIINSLLFKHYGRLLLDIAMDYVGSPYNNIVGYETVLEVANYFKNYTYMNKKSLKPKKIRKIMLEIDPDIATTGSDDNLELKFAYAKNLYYFGNEEEKELASDIFYDIATFAKFKKMESQQDYKSIYKDQNF